MFKTCTEPACARPLRARGLCSTHYNQRYQPGRHAPTQAACVVCSASILRSRKSSRRPTCSTSCRRTVQFGPRTATTTAYSWALDAAKRAREAGVAVIELFDRTEVFERDGWSCYLCCRATDPDASPFDPSSPTVDHVVPLSQGGAHSLANARTACLHCNSAKQAGPPVTVSS